MEICWVLFCGFFFFLSLQKSNLYFTFENYWCQHFYKRRLILLVSCENRFPASVQKIAELCGLFMKLYYCKIASSDPHT